MTSGYMPLSCGSPSAGVRRCRLLAALVATQFVTQLGAQLSGTGSGSAFSLVGDVAEGSTVVIWVAIALRAVRWRVAERCASVPPAGRSTPVRLDRGRRTAAA
jgi:hypothetical protein